MPLAPALPKYGTQFATLNPRRELRLTGRHGNEARRSRGAEALVGAGVRDLRYRGCGFCGSAANSGTVIAKLISVRL